MKKLGENGLSGTSKRMIDKFESTVAPSEVICDGDSWVFGCEIVDPEIAKKYNSTTHPGAYDFLPENDPYRIPKIFPTHLSNLLNVPVTNLSWPADDNGTILRRTINYISQKYLANNISTDNLFVIIGWSSPERNSFWYIDDNIKLSHPFRLWPQVPHFESKEQEKFWELYVAYLWNAQEYIPRYVLNVLQLQNFCTAHNIKWMCFNSFYQTPNESPGQWNDLNIIDEIEKIKGRIGGHEYQISTNPLKRIKHINDYSALWASIDPVRFYKKDKPNNTFKSYIETPKNKVIPPLVGWHPSPRGHKAWARELFRYIKQHNLY